MVTATDKKETVSSA